VADKRMINIRLDPEVWKRAKAAAGERGTTLERWVTEALEAHIGRQRTAASGGADGATASTAGVDVSNLEWRISALEQAVDFLASQLGGGFASGTASAGAGPAGGDERPA
jgi:hypothetical protein